MLKQLSKIHDVMLLLTGWTKKDRSLQTPPSKTPSLLYITGIFGHIQVNHKLEENAINAHACSAKNEQKTSNLAQLEPDDALVLITGAYHLLLSTRSCWDDQEYVCSHWWPGRSFCRP